MNLVYSKNERPQIYFIFALLLLIIFIAGVYFVNRYLWYILILLGILLIKGVSILKNKVIPVIKLDDKGLTILKENEQNHFYPYSEIIDIQMNSNLLNGFIKTKNNSKKLRLDSVSIHIEKQREIVEIVKGNILK